MRLFYLGVGCKLSRILCSQLAQGLWVLEGGHGQGSGQTSEKRHCQSECGWNTNMGRMEGKQGCRDLRYAAGCLRSLCGNESHKRILKGKVTWSALARGLIALGQHAGQLRSWVRDTRA